MPAFALPQFKPSALNDTSEYLSTFIVNNTLVIPSLNDYFNQLAEAYKTSLDNQVHQQVYTFWTSAGLVLAAPSPDNRLFKQKRDNDAAVRPNLKQLQGNRRPESSDYNNWQHTLIIEKTDDNDSDPLVLLLNDLQDHALAALKHYKICERKYGQDFENRKIIFTRGDNALRTDRALAILHFITSGFLMFGLKPHISLYQYMLLQPFPQMFGIKSYFNTDEENYKRAESKFLCHIQPIQLSTLQTNAINQVKMWDFTNMLPIRFLSNVQLYMNVKPDIVTLPGKVVKDADFE